MICRTCHGNGYVRQTYFCFLPKKLGRKTINRIASCKTCDSQGEIKESKNAENRDD
jgi:DnaJ-class molecular chaperone